MLEFKPLASSSAGCAYHLVCAPHSLLLDAGLPIKDLRSGTNYQLAKLDGALITHHHGDHVHGVRDLIAMGVDCYATEATWRILDIPIQNNVHEVRPLQRIMVGKWIVTPFDAVHDAEGTVGYTMISPEGHKCVYLTDSAYARYTFGEGVTHIFIEANFSNEILSKNKSGGEIDGHRARRITSTHMSIDKLIELLRANDLSNLREVWLLHLSDRNSDAEQFKQRVQAATGVPVYVAEKRSQVAR